MQPVYLFSAILAFFWSLVIYFGIKSPFKIEDMLVFIVFLVFITLILCYGLIYVLKEKAKNKDVNLEDVNFEKRFNVKSQDQIKSRCILTPKFMEKFFNLKTAFKARKIECTFSKEFIIFFIQTNKNCFEIAQINKSLLGFTLYKNALLEINAVYELIDYFQFGENK